MVTRRSGLVPFVWMVNDWYAFDRKVLQNRAEQAREGYQGADPFPHCVVDGLFPDDVLRRILDEFAEPDERWRSFADPKQRKYGAGDAEITLGPATTAVLAALNSGPFVDFLATVTGIEETLIPDPHLKGGGLHQIAPGGYLKVHADFNRHPLTKLDRRVNVLLYLNEDWDPDWGGQLELWDTEMSSAVKRISPVFNRMVIFSITDTAFHGHPDPLRCPEGRYRRSLATYYYSNGRPESERSPDHSTLFQARPTQPEELS